MKRWNSLLELLHSYSLLIGSIVIGVTIRLLKPSWLTFLEPFGTTYFGILEMWALPIMFTSLILAVFKFSCRGNLRTKASSILIFSSVTLFLTFTAVAVANYFLTPSQDLSPETLRLLGTLINDAGNSLEIELLTSYDLGQNSSNLLVEFLFSIIPENIFTALSQDIAIQVVFFAILFGLALTWSRTREGDAVPNLLELIYKTMTQITEWVGAFVPIVLCLEVASLDVSWHDLLAMKDFVLIVSLLFFTVSLISIGLIWKQSQFSFPFVLYSLEESSLLVLTSQEGLTAIPASIRVLHNELGFDRETVDLIVPLAVTIFRVGSFVYLLLVIFFIGGLYQVHFGFFQLVIMIIGIAFCSIATSTATGGGELLLLILPVMAILDLPLDGMMAPLIAIDLILQPFRELSTVYTSMALAALVAKSERPTPS